MARRVTYQWKEALSVAVELHLETAMAYRKATREEQYSRES
jgi:hypothetical protein